ncbi:MAG: hypothetical protein MUO82_09435 [Candidatus Thermoplasmatota archaeon]|nr:hypothetical protein [Candidatus Thermoplasmatota archaeon]
MEEDFQYIINKFLNNPSFTSESLLEYLRKNPIAISAFKELIEKDEQNESHELIVQYILKKPLQERKELLEEVCKIHRKPFLTHRSSLSRVVIANEEVFLHILRNDKRFFIVGPEFTSVDVIEEQLTSIFNTFYPFSFSKEKMIRKKEIYDAMVTLEDNVNPPLITTTKLHPGTGTGKRRRKRYCLSDSGFNQITTFLSLVIRDELDNVQKQI